MYVETLKVLMSRVQLALNVDDLDQSIAFYTKLFGTGPAKVKPGYANFAVADPAQKLVLLENPGQGGSINHLGVEVDSSDKVHADRTPDRGATLHRGGDRRDLLFRHPGQGVGHRARFGTLGGRHGPRLRRDVQR